MTQQDSSPSNLRYPAWQREYEARAHNPTWCTVQIESLRVV